MLVHRAHSGVLALLEDEQRHVVDTKLPGLVTERIRIFFERIPHEHDGLHAFQTVFKKRMFEDTMNLRVATKTTDLRHSPEQGRCIAAPFTALELTKPAVVAKLDIEATKRTGGLEHFTLESAGTVPGWLPARRGIQRKHESSPVAVAPANRRLRDFLQKLTDGAGPCSWWFVAGRHGWETLEVKCDNCLKSQLTRIHVPKKQAPHRLVVATSSSALFDLAESDRVFREEGLRAYAQYQIERENEPLMPGDAFHLVKKLLRLNDLQDEEVVEVILLSRNSADTGLRVFNSIQHHGLPITRAAFTGGAPPYRYMVPFRCHLFLSTNADDVREALVNGMAAASILSGGQRKQGNDALKIAFDGDAVIFSDEAEQVFKSAGLAEFARTEQEAANRPLMGGPFQPFLAALHRLQTGFAHLEESPIRTALVTARAAPAHERVIKTLRAWEIRLDESLFLGGMTKAEFLVAFDADVFFDDQAEHCRLANEVVATGHVPHGVANDPEPGAGG